MEVKWKEKNEKYLDAMQRFLDKAENVENEKLRVDIIGQVLKLDEIITELAVNEINKNKNDENNK